MQIKLWKTNRFHYFTEQPLILTWKILVLLKKRWFEVHALWNWNWKFQDQKKNMEKREWIPLQWTFSCDKIDTDKSVYGWSVEMYIHWIAWNKISSWPSSIYSFIHAVRPATPAEHSLTHKPLLEFFSSMVMKFLCSLIIDITSSYQCQHETNRSIFESLWI